MIIISYTLNQFLTDKKSKVKLDRVTDINMLLMVEKEEEQTIRGVLEEEYVTLFIDMQKPITNI